MQYQSSDALDTYAEDRSEKLKFKTFFLGRYAMKTATPDDEVDLLAFVDEKEDGARFRLIRPTVFEPLAPMEIQAQIRLRFLVAGGFLYDKFVQDDRSMANSKLSHDYQGRTWTR